MQDVNAPERGTNDPGLFFAYGTLGPDASAMADRGGWRPDAVRGRLYDLGPYPILVDWDDPTAGWVVGHVRPTDRIELERVLDPYEGVNEGLYRRLVLQLRSGQAAWTYVYPHPVPSGARGPMTRWSGRRVAPRPPDGRTPTLEGGRPWLSPRPRLGTDR